MDWFELNSHLRFLRSTISTNINGQQPQKLFQPNPSTSSLHLANSGQRFEQLKSLRKLLKKFPHRLNVATIVSIFNVLKSILKELTLIYFDLSGGASLSVNYDGTNRTFDNKNARHNSIAIIPNGGVKPSPLLKKTLSTENVFVAATRRNEILESIQIIIDMVSMKLEQLANNNNNVVVGSEGQTTGNTNHNESISESNRSSIEPANQEDFIGRIFLPEIITLLGHESSDVQRNCIRFLQLYITHTHNLQRLMQAFIEYGLQSMNVSTQFGALNSLPHLFIRKELRAENLGPVVNSLADMLVETQTKRPHVFYPTYVALERINSLIGSRRFYQYLLNSGEQAVCIYETVQKRAPSPQVYIDYNPGFNNTTTTASNNNNNNNDYNYNGGGNLMDPNHAGNQQQHNVGKRTNQDNATVANDNRNNQQQQQQQQQRQTQPGQESKAIMNKKYKPGQGLNQSSNVRRSSVGSTAGSSATTTYEPPTMIMGNDTIIVEEEMMDESDDGDGQQEPIDPNRIEASDWSEPEEDEEEQPEVEVNEMDGHQQNGDDSVIGYDYPQSTEIPINPNEDQWFQEQEANQPLDNIGSDEYMVQDYYGEEEDRKDEQEPEDPRPTPYDQQQLEQQQSHVNHPTDNNMDHQFGRKISATNGKKEENRKEEGENITQTNNVVVVSVVNGSGHQVEDVEEEKETEEYELVVDSGHSTKLSGQRFDHYNAHNNINNNNNSYGNVPNSVATFSNDNNQKNNDNDDCNSNEKPQAAEVVAVDEYQIKMKSKTNFSDRNPSLTTTVTAAAATNTSNGNENSNHIVNHYGKVDGVGHLNPNRPTKRNSLVGGTSSEHRATPRANHPVHHHQRQVTFANGYKNHNHQDLNVQQRSTKFLNPNPHPLPHLSSISSDDDNNLQADGDGLSVNYPEYYHNYYYGKPLLNHRTNHSTANTASKSSPPINQSANQSKLEEKMATATATNHANHANHANENDGFVPPKGLASLVELDADTLANMDYIPTMKDYYLPYYHPYYFDPLYHPAPPLATAPFVPPPPIASTATNLHLLRFGIFPRVLIYQALSSIAEEQFAAIQAIVRIVRDVPYEHLLLLLPHMDEFLSVFVAQLLLDGTSNFKVILWTLDIIELLTERLKQRLNPNLSQLVSLLAQRLGDNRIVIRDSVIKVFHQMMSIYSPQEMLDLLFKHCSAHQTHQVLTFTSGSKLREELVNRVTAAVATFPRSRLNLPKLCFDVVPFLVDRRSLVRLAALECVATLAQALGPHKLGSLMTAVHSLESSLTAIDFDRLIAAIQARLARRSLPRVGPDGNVQYVLRVPTSNESWYYRRIYDADLEWITLGPTTPPSNVPTVLNTPTVVPTLAPTFNVLDSSENSSSEAPATADQRNNDLPVLSKMAETSQQDELLARQQMSVNSADSEDIPPPVKSKVIVTSPGPTLEPDHLTMKRTRSRSRSKSTNKIDPDSMAQDSQSPLRNFADRQQQKEVEQRFQSLENTNRTPITSNKRHHHHVLHRSKTSQEYRPYGDGGGGGGGGGRSSRNTKRRDLYIDRLVRGESVDDSDLADAQYFRRESSTESLEAWRQYFSRFKKQLADISLMGGIGGRYGSSRPGSSVYYGLSPLPPPPGTMAPIGPGPGMISPSLYYYYYVQNPLSHSYHDLSQLQQKNMLQIMRRSGFLVSQDDQPEKEEGPSTSKVELETDGGDGGQKSKRTTGTNTTNNKDDDDTRTRNSSKPSRIAKQSSQQKTIVNHSKNNPITNNNSSRDVQSSMDGDRSDDLSDEPTNFQQQRQLEPDPLPLERSLSMPSIRTDSSAETDHRSAVGPGVASGAIHHQNSQEHQPVISDEVIQELGMWEQVIQEEKGQQQQQQRRKSSTTQGVQDQKEDHEEKEKEEEEEEEEERIVADQRQQQQRQPSPKPETSIPTVSVELSSANIQGTPKDPMSEQSQPKASEQSQQQQVSKDDQKMATTKRKESLKPPVPASTIPTNEDSSKKTTGTDQPSSKPTFKPPAVTKTGPPAPPSRRLSRAPQQLYIKTTPAIPMNANIQHILANVARTEGPFDNPNEAVKAAVIALRDHAWTTKVEGMLAVVRLATFHPHHLLRDQHQIALALASETRNLRSTVARSAIFTIGELFAKLRSQIEPELDILTQALLHKVSENSVFIREDVERALQLMIDHMPQTRAALALITYGSSHRNTHVRRTCAQFLSMLVEKMGPLKCLLGPRDIGEHLLPAAARFLQDHSAHTRYFGRRIFAVLMQHPLFDKFLRKHVSPGTYRNICGMLETIKRRGVGDPPPDLYSPTVQPKHSDPRRLIVVDGVTTPS